jgi:nicotinamidase-related amidase
MVRFGNDINYWIQSEEGMDLSRGAQEALRCETSTMPIVYDPKKSALVIIDMQNFFCSEKLGRGDKGRKLIPNIVAAVEKARQDGVRVVWVNWGVRPDLANLPPNVLRSFYRDSIYTGFGGELPDGLGPVLVKDSWSADLADGLREVRQEQDIWVDKNRTSGFFGTELNQILLAQGITTLFFGGVNTDQCVFGTLQDAHCYGFDCVLLTDCTATTSPAGAYESVVWNVERSYGFATTSEQFCQANAKTARELADSK